MTLAGTASSFPLNPLPLTNDVTHAEFDGRSNATDATTVVSGESSGLLFLGELSDVLQASTDETPLGKAPGADVSEGAEPGSTTEPGLVALLLWVPMDRLPAAQTTPMKSAGLNPPAPDGVSLEGSSHLGEVGSIGACSPSVAGQDRQPVNPPASGMPAPLMSSLRMSPAGAWDAQVPEANDMPASSVALQATPGRLVSDVRRDSTLALEGGIIRLSVSSMKTVPTVPSLQRLSFSAPLHEIVNAEGQTEYPTTFTLLRGARPESGDMVAMGDRFQDTVVSPPALPPAIPELPLGGVKLRQADDVSLRAAAVKEPTSGVPAGGSGWSGNDSAFHLRLDRHSPAMATVESKQLLFETRGTAQNAEVSMAVGEIVQPVGKLALRKEPESPLGSSGKPSGEVKGLPLNLNARFSDPAPPHDAEGKRDSMYRGLSGDVQSSRATPKGEPARVDAAVRNEATFAENLRSDHGSDNATIRYPLNSESHVPAITPLQVLEGTRADTRSPIPPDAAGLRHDPVVAKHASVDSAEHAPLAAQGRLTEISVVVPSRDSSRVEVRLKETQGGEIFLDVKATDPATRIELRDSLHDLIRGLDLRGLTASEAHSDAHMPLQVHDRSVDRTSDAGAETSSDGGRGSRQPYEQQTQDNQNRREAQSDEWLRWMEHIVWQTQFNR